MKDHSAGLDSRKLSDKKGIPAEEWPGHFNLWLLAGYQLCRGETVLLLKYNEAGDPPKYPPIRMSDIVVRCFPKKAFHAGDGIGDLAWFIQSVIKYHQDSLRPLNVAFVDKKKAFHLVSLQSILVAAELPFSGYIRDVYRGNSNDSKAGQQESNGKMRSESQNYFPSNTNLEGKLSSKNYLRFTAVLLPNGRVLQWFAQKVSGKFIF